MDPFSSTSPDGADTLEFTNANWQKEVVESKIPVVVDFGASWCGPCRKLAPTIDGLAIRYKGKVKVGKVDIDKEPEIAKKYGINGIPHVIIFNGGDEPRKEIDGKVVSEQPVGQFLWFILFDAIHHRGQLAAYLRPMGGKVPAIYGPSADARVTEPRPQGSDTTN